MLMDHHPTSEEFEDLLRSVSRRGGAARNSRIVRHLLADCPSCRGRLSSMGWAGRRLERLLQLPASELGELVDAPAPASSYDYSGAFAAAERALDAFLSPARSAGRPPEELLAELAPLPVEEQARLVASDARFADPQLVRLLVERSHAARYAGPEKMLLLARLAHLAAEACTPEAAGSAERLADLHAKAWGQYGNALRVAGQLQEAEGALATAERRRREGTGDPPLRARLLEQTASLAIFQRRFQTAVELTEEAGQVYRELGETHSLASTMVQKAIATLYAGEPESAIHTLNRAIPLIDQEDDPQLLLAACHNLAICYVALDRPEQSLALYFKARELYKELKDPLILLRAAWQEGQLLRDLGHLRAAEASLLRARRGFVELGLPYEVAVVSLDLSAIYVKLGATEQVKQTVAETMPIFRSLRVGRDALASLIQLQKVADQEHEAMALIRTLAARLEQMPNRHLLK